jgi:hypothetical protein
MEIILKSSSFHFSIKIYQIFLSVRILSHLSLLESGNHILIVFLSREVILKLKYFDIKNASSSRKIQKIHFLNIFNLFEYFSLNISYISIIFIFILFWYKYYLKKQNHLKRCICFFVNTLFEKSKQEKYL